MCCRIFLPGEDDGNYEKILSMLKNKEHTKLYGEIRPKDTVAVIANSKSLAPSVFCMRWGFTEYGKLIFNTRSETAGQKPVFSESMHSRRCVIPAAYYFEWDGSKQKHRVYQCDDGLMYLAGIYRFEEKLPVFSVLTREPTEKMRLLHNRMPVILPQKAVKPWLSGKENPEQLIIGSVENLFYEPA